MNIHYQRSLVLLVGLLGVNLKVKALPAFVVPSGAHGCSDCHLTEEGEGYKPGVIEAFQGGIPGLKAFIKKLQCQQNPKAPICVTPKNNTDPALLPIQAQWDVTVGETPLVIPLLVNDQENDQFNITFAQPSESPRVIGAKLSAERTDLTTRLPAIDFVWSPKASQANKSYVVHFTAREKGPGRNKASKAVTANITVWPARPDGIARPSVSEFKLQRAQWLNNQLHLSGAVVFRSGLNHAQQQAAVKRLNVNMRSNSGVKVGDAWRLSVDKGGTWQKVLALPDAVPCIIKLNYDGLNATGPIKLAPANCLK
jgi:hypothetical protein